MCKKPNRESQEEQTSKQHGLHGPRFRSCLKVPVLMTFRDRPWYGSVSKPKQPFLPHVAFGSGAVYHSDRNLTKTIVNPRGSGSAVAENPLFFYLPPLFVLLLKGVARLYSKDLQGPGSFPRLLLCSLGSAWGLTDRINSGLSSPGTWVPHASLSFHWILRALHHLHFFPFLNGKVFF